MVTDIILYALLYIAIGFVSVFIIKKLGLIQDIEEEIVPVILLFWFVMIPVGIIMYLADKIIK